MKNQTDLVILILSSKDNKERRQAQRDTWLKNIHIPYRFILGIPFESLESDSLWVNAEDTDLPEKLLIAYKTCLRKFDFKHIFTCDDDTYVVVDRLLNCGYEEHMYMGNKYTFKEGAREGKSHAEGGGGFFLSREAIERITQVPLDHELIDGPSDTAIGDLAKMYSIKLYNDNRFVQGYSTKKRHGELPTPLNNVITSHYLDAKLFHKVHSQFSHAFWSERLAKDLKVSQAKSII